jgi:hypothetical protein
LPHWGCCAIEKITFFIHLQFKDVTNSVEKKLSSEDTHQEIFRIPLALLQDPATVTIIGHLNPIHDLASYILTPSFKS